MYLSVSRPHKRIALLVTTTALSLQFVRASSNSSPSTTLPTQSSNQYTHQPRQINFPEVRHGLEGTVAGGQIIKIELEIDQAGQEISAPCAAAGSPTLLPISPFVNRTESTDATTTVTLPNGDLVEIEQHVNFAFGMSTRPTLPNTEAVGGASPAPPHLISISLPSPASLEQLTRKICSPRETVTITRTAYVTSTATQISTKYITSTHTVTREQAESMAVAKVSTKRMTQVQPVLLSTRKSVSSIKVMTKAKAKIKTYVKPQPTPIPKSKPTPIAEPKPATEPAPIPQSKPEPEPKPAPQPQPEPKPAEAPTPFDNEMVSQHNRWRAKYSAGPLAHDPVLVGKAQEWLKQCVWEHPPGLSSNLYSAGGAIANSVAMANKAVNAWVNGPGEVESWDPNNPTASHFTQVVWKSATKIGCAYSACNLAIYDPKWWPATNTSRHQNTGWLGLS